VLIFDIHSIETFAYTIKNACVSLFNYGCFTLRLKMELNAQQWMCKVTLLTLYNTSNTQVMSNNKWVTIISQFLSSISGSKNGCLTEYSIYLRKISNHGASKWDEWELVNSVVWRKMIKNKIIKAVAEYESITPGPVEEILSLQVT